MEEWSDQLLPEGFRKRMLRLLGKEAEDAFLASYSAAPLRRGLRVNTLKCGIHRLRELFSLPLEPLPFSTAGFFLPTEHRAGADPLHHAGAYYMQEPSAMVRRDRAGPPAGRTGTGSLRRTRRKIHPDRPAALDGRGLLWSNEYVRCRAAVLQQNLERCGVRNAVVSSSAVEPLCRRLTGFFDAVLLDAPWLRRGDVPQGTRLL